MIPYGYGGKELGSAFRTVRKNTIQIAEEIPEEKYSFAPAPDTKTVEKVLTHIAIVPQISEEIHKTKRVTSLAGFDFLALRDRLLAEEAKERSKAEIVALLQTEGERFAEWLNSLSTEFLEQQVTQPDGKSSKSRFEMLLGTKEHEMHHRGQLMLIERLVGIVPHMTRQFNERLKERAAKA